MCSEDNKGCFTLSKSPRSPKQSSQTFLILSMAVNTTERRRKCRSYFSLVFSLSILIMRTRAALSAHHKPYQKTLLDQYIHKRFSKRTFPIQW